MRVLRERISATPAQTDVLKDVRYSRYSRITMAHIIIMSCKCSLLQNAKSTSTRGCKIEQICACYKELIICGDIVCLHSHLPSTLCCKQNDIFYRYFFNKGGIHIFICWF